MAKVRGPLLSISADGQIGKSQVYGSWRGVPYVRQYVEPANPNSAAQQVVRNAFKTLQSLWLRAPAQLQDVFTEAAKGRPYTNRNRHTQLNLPLLRGDADMQDYLASPGVNGAPPLVGLAAVGGSGSGEIDVDFTMPTPPTGWTITSSVAIAFPDQDPNDAFTSSVGVIETLSAPWDGTITGLTANVLHVVSGWAELTKPDGSFAASLAVTTTATSTA